MQRQQHVGNTPQHRATPQRRRLSPGPRTLIRPKQATKLLTLDPVPLPAKTSTKSLQVSTADPSDTKTSAGNLFAIFAGLVLGTA